MKKLAIILVSIPLILISCGPSAQEKARIEQERADSIAEAQAKELALKQEQERKDSIERAEQRALKWEEDSTEIMKLLPSFTIAKDTELESKRIYTAKGISTAHFRNEAYLSFTTMGTKVDKLLLNVEVAGNNSILLTKSIVFIGDDTYDISPIGEAGYSADRFPNIGEWMTGEVSSSLMEKILDAESLKVKAVGSDGDKLITISSGNLKKMKETIELYKLFKNSKVICE